jgi:hypothetical protein
MTLAFPNQIRSYDHARDCICFWGSDSALEVAFQVEFAALRQMTADARNAETDEVALLAVFDANRTRIQKAAGTAYSRHRRSYHRLSLSDF